jgi:cystathionine beta-lyase
MTALVGAVGTGASLDIAEAFEADSTSGSGKHDFDTPYNRFGTDCVKWDRQARIYGKDNIVAGMGIADMDFRCAPAITKALTDRIHHENWGYLDIPPSFAESIVSWNKRRYGIDINPELLLLTTGVHTGIISVLQTFSPPGSKILLLTPGYDGFYSDVSYVRCTPEECQMKLVNGRYSIDFEDLERHISHDTNTLILCNPHNPTGNCWSPEDLTRVGEICTRRRVLVLADEIHCDFVTKGNKYTPFSTLANRDIVMNSITFKSASKSFGISALKSAWMFSYNADLIAKVRANHRQDFNTLGMIASRAAYTGGADWLDQLVPYIDANQDYAASFIASNIPLIKVAKAQGTYLAWLDVTKVAEKIGAKEMAAEANQKITAGMKPVTPEVMVERWFVKNAKVHMNPGSNYGLGGANHMRMNLATSRKTLELALNNLADALKRV